MKLKIVRLSEHPEMRITLAHWHHQQWGNFYPERSVTDWLSTLEVHQELPIIFVALNSEIAPPAPVGMVTIRWGSAAIFDEDGLIELAGLFVIPDYRNQGAASQLMHHACAETQRLFPGYNSISLFTHGHGQLYKKNGWRLVTEKIYREQKATIWKMPLLSQR